MSKTGWLATISLFRVIGSRHKAMWETSLALSMFLLGWILSARSEHYYIKLKAKPQWRTAMYVDGQFFYVIPEKEYVDLTRKATQ